MTDPIDCDDCGTRILPIGTRCPLCGHEHDDTPDVTVTHDLTQRHPRTSFSTTDMDLGVETDPTSTTEWLFTLW